jgi:hypothetical protein
MIALARPATSIEPPCVWKVFFGGFIRAVPRVHRHALSGRPNSRCTMPTPSGLVST